MKRKPHINVANELIIKPAALPYAALTFHCTVTPGSSNSVVQHLDKLQHHSPVQRTAPTAEQQQLQAHQLHQKLNCGFKGPGMGRCGECRRKKDNPEV